MQKPDYFKIAPREGFKYLGPEMQTAIELLTLGNHGFGYFRYISSRQGEDNPWGFVRFDPRSHDLGVPDSKYNIRVDASNAAKQHLHNQGFMWSTVDLDEILDSIEIPTDH